MPLLCVTETTSSFDRLGISATAFDPLRDDTGTCPWRSGHILNEAGRLGINPVLLVCDAGNVASATIIERNGGVFEGVKETDHGLVRRYWITTF